MAPYFSNDFRIKCYVFPIYSLPPARNMTCQANNWFQPSNDINDRKPNTWEEEKVQSITDKTRELVSTKV